SQTVQDENAVRARHWPPPRIAEGMADFMLSGRAVQARCVAGQFSPGHLVCSLTRPVRSWVHYSEPHQRDRPSSNIEILTLMPSVPGEVMDGSESSILAACLRPPVEAAAADGPQAYRRGQEPYSVRCRKACMRLRLLL